MSNARQKENAELNNLIDQALDSLLSEKHKQLNDGIGYVFNYVYHKDPSQDNQSNPEVKKPEQTIEHKNNELTQKETAQSTIQRKQKKPNNTPSKPKHTLKQPNKKKNHLKPAVRTPEKMKDKQKPAYPLNDLFKGLIENTSLVLSSLQSSLSSFSFFRKSKLPANIRQEIQKKQARLKQ